MRSVTTMAFVQTLLFTAVANSDDDAQVNAWVERAREPYLQGEYRQAIAMLDEALKMHPDSVILIGFRGTNHRKLGEYDEAIQDYTAAIELTPGNTRWYYDRGIANHESGRFEQAIADFTENIRGIPHHTAAYDRRADSLQAVGRYKEAIDDFEIARRIIHANPNHNRVGAARSFADHAWLLACCPDEEYRDGNRALLLAWTGCEFSGWRLPECLEALAAAYAELGVFDKAVEYQETALELGQNGASESRLRHGMEERLQQYQSDEPFRLPVVTR